MAYKIYYRALNGSSHSHIISKDITSIVINVEYEKHYTFQIQAVTTTGRSDVATETWFSHAGTKYETSYDVCVFVAI